MADQNDERDLHVELQIFFHLPGIKNMSFDPFPDVKSIFQRFFQRGSRVSEISPSNKSGTIDLCEGRT